MTNTIKTAEAAEATLTDFYKKLSKTGVPLDYSNDADRPYYVEALHGHGDPTSRLLKEVQNQVGDSVYLFSGQLGSGKSTELLRLKSKLIDRGIKAYYIDLEEWLNLFEPLDLGSFLVAILAAWVDLLEVPGVVDQPLHRRLWRLLTETKIVPVDAEFDIGIGKLKGEIKSNQNFRASIEKKLSDNTNSFVQQAHLLSQELRSQLCESPEHDCVLIIDSLEKMQGYGEHPELVYESLKKIFLSQSDALRLLGLKTIYSVPPVLVEANPQLVANFGHGNLVNMPSVHIFKKHSTELDPTAVGRMTAMLERYYSDWRAVFKPEQLKTLIELTGSDLRSFFRAIRVCLTEDVQSLPLADAAIDYALNQIAPPRMLHRSVIVWMAALERSHDVSLDGVATAAMLQQYLTTKHIFIYMNGKAWYAVHPLLRDWILAQVPETTAPAAVTAPTTPAVGA